MTEKFTSKKNQYEVISKHAEGGFGVTYRVKSLSDHKEYLLKKLQLTQAGDWKAVELFEREANFLANLSHPQIPRCIDSFHHEPEGNFFLVQDFIEGQTLQEHTSKKIPLPLQKYLDYLKQSLEVLDFLHSLVPPTIHRDVTPKNLIVSPNGKVFLVDFGSVKSALLAQTNMTSVGTFGFMAPEQTMGQPQTASDLYSLGMTFIALAAQADPSQLPIDPNTGRIDIRKALSLPSWVIGLLESMTQPGVAARIGSAKLALARLAKGEEKPKPAPQPPQSVVAQPPKSRGGLWFLLAIIGSIWLFSKLTEKPSGVSSPNMVGLLGKSETKIERLERECAEGNADSCTDAGYQYSNGKEVARDYDKAFQYYQKACDMKQYLGCNNLGNMHERGRGTAKDLARAVELYTLACSKDIGLACNNLGLCYQDAVGVAVDNVKAEEFFKKGCDLKNGGSCNNLAFFYEKGTGGAPDLTRAVSFYREACNLKHGLGCNNLALCYRDAIGVTQDYIIASEYFLKACDLEHGSACNNLGILYGDGTGVLANKKTAANYYTRGCDLGTMSACSNLGYAYNYGEGVKKDYARAFALYQKSCDGGSTLGCNNLGSLYLDGYGVEADAARAFTLFQGACDKDEMIGCSNLASMYKAGKHVAVDLAKAKELYKKACDGGRTGACEEVKK